MTAYKNIDVAFELLLGCINETETSTRQEAANGILRPGKSLASVKTLAEEICRFEKLRQSVLALAKGFRGKTKQKTHRVVCQSPVTTSLLERLYLEYLADGATRENWEVARNIGVKIAHIATTRDLELSGSTPRWESKLRSAKHRLIAAGKVEYVDAKRVRLSRAA